MGFFYIIYNVWYVQCMVRYLVFELRLCLDDTSLAVNGIPACNPPHPSSPRTDDDAAELKAERIIGRGPDRDRCAVLLEKPLRYV